MSEQPKRPWTPWPWRVGSTFSTHNAPTRFWETGVSSVAGVGRVLTSSGATREEAEANAAIGAAAPELYEALEDILPLAGVQILPENYEEVTARVKKARAALAKANPEAR